MELSILYQDDELVAINKPHGLAVHASPMIGNTDIFALQLLRDQLGHYVYPLHRIDRKTSGILLFATNKKMHTEVHQLFMNRQIDKVYLAIVRGFLSDSGTIDKELTNETGKSQSALTHYKCLEKSELPISFDKHTTSRYSLVQISIETGRTHQIRRHFNHLRHPIIGDRPHGCSKQNKLFKERWNMDSMLLHAWQMKFIHPKYQTEICIQAPVSEEFARMLKELQFSDPLLF